MLRPQIHSDLDQPPQRHLSWTKNSLSSFSFHSGQEENFRSGYKLIWKVTASTLSLAELFLLAVGRKEAVFFQAQCQAGSHMPPSPVGQSRQEQMQDNNGKRSKPVGAHQEMVWASIISLHPSILSLHSQSSSGLSRKGGQTTWAPPTSFLLLKKTAKPPLYLFIYLFMCLFVCSFICFSCLVHARIARISRMHVVAYTKISHKCVQTSEENG